MLMAGLRSAMEQNDDPPDPPDPPDPGTRIELGANTDWSHYYSTNFPFGDRMKVSGWEVTTMDGFGYPPVALPALDSDGWPAVALPYTVSGTPYTLRARMASGQAVAPWYPTGTYVLEWEGTGTIAVGGEAPNGTHATSPVNITIPSTSGGGFFIFIASSAAPPNNVRNIRCWMPGQQGNLWNTDWIALHDGIDIIRYVNMLKIDETAEPAIVNWADRTPPTYYSQTLPGRGGIAHENIIALSNTYSKSPHVNFHDTVNDDYLQGAVALYEATCTPKVEFEHTNEFWNPIFPHHWRLVSAAIALGLHQVGEFQGDPGLGWVQFYSSLKLHVRKTCSMGAIIRAAYGSTDGPRATAHLGSFVLGDAGVIGYQLRAIRDPAVNPLWVPGVSVMRDFVGCTLLAPYWGNSANAMLEANPAMDIEDFMDELVANAYDEVIEYVTSFINVLQADATAQGYTRLPFAGYEIGYNAQSGNSAVLERMYEARAHTRMQEAYAEAYRAWFELTDRYCAVLGFISADTWGATRHQYASPREPTWLAIQDQIAAMS